MKSITSVQTNCRKRLSDGDHMTNWRCSWIWSILHGKRFPCWIKINLQVFYVHLCQHICLCLKVSLSTSLSKFEGSFVNCLPAWCCVCLSIWPLRIVTETTLHSTPSMRHLHPMSKIKCNHMEKHCKNCKRCPVSRIKGSMSISGQILASMTLSMSKKMSISTSINVK